MILHFLPVDSFPGRQAVRSAGGPTQPSRRVAALGGRLIRLLDCFAFGAFWGHIQTMIAVETEPKPTDQTPKRTIHRRITIQDAEFIASDVARGLTEVDACHRAGIKPAAWWNWKKRVRNVRKCEELFARALGSRKHNLLGEMEKAATGSGGVRHDWRAAQALAGIVDPRLGGQPQALQAQAQITIDATKLVRIAELYARLPAPQLADAQAVPLLTTGDSQGLDRQPAPEPAATEPTVTPSPGPAEWPSGKD